MTHMLFTVNLPMWQCNLCNLHDTQYSIYVCMACISLLCATFLPPRTCVQRTEIVCWYQRCRLPLLGTRCSFLTTPSSIGTSSLGRNSFGMPFLSNNAHHTMYMYVSSLNIHCNSSEPCSMYTRTACPIQLWTATREWFKYTYVIVETLCYVQE